MLDRNWGQVTINLKGDSLEDILYSFIEGMGHCRQGRRSVLVDCTWIVIAGQR
jgi:hypothetical protein